MAHLRCSTGPSPNFRRPTARNVRSRCSIPEPLDRERSRRCSTGCWAMLSARRWQQRRQPPRRWRYARWRSALRDICPRARMQGVQPPESDGKGRRLSDLTADARHASFPAMTASFSYQDARPWRATILTLFPEMFPGPLGISLAGKALASGLWELEARDIRDSATDKHRSVDDTPAGGGPGMVLRADILAAAIDTANVSPDRPRLLMSPRGRPLTQGRVMELANGPGPLIVCGRFEGIDQRVIEGRSLEEVSVGDYVLSGGEIAAMALVDACVRLLPGVMGKEASGAEESFSEGLLEYPQYTRPQVFEGRTIPEILTSGDHAKVAAWRRAEAEALTRIRRPDLWAARSASGGGQKNTTDG